MTRPDRRRLAFPILVVLSLALVSLPAAIGSDGTQLTAATLVGGPFLDGAEAVAIGPDGTVYVAGYTYTENYEWDGYFVARLSADLTRILWESKQYSTNWLSIDDLAVGPDGSAYVVGDADGNAPLLMTAYDSSYNGGGDAYAAKFSANGGFMWGTYLGGSASDSAHSVDLDPSGRVTIVGATESCDFPTTPGAYRRVVTGCPWADGWRYADGFVAKLSADGTRLEAATVFGGTDYDEAHEVAVSRASGSVLVAGQTGSEDLPVGSSAYGTTPDSWTEGFVAKFDNTLGRLERATYLHGGSYGVQVTGLARDGAGNVWVAGITLSDDFRTTPGAYQTTMKGQIDCPPRAGMEHPCDEGFVVKLAPDLTRAYWSTYLGGSSHDRIGGIAVDGSGRTHVAGDTYSPDLATSIRPNTGNIDAFYAILSANGARLDHVQGFGAPDGQETGSDVALSGASAYVAGETSDNFTTTPGAARSGPAQDGDAFVARFGPSTTGGAATFDHKGGNEWWVEVKVTGATPTRVQAMDANSPWTELSLKSWGNWAGSFRIEPGNTVKFRAMVDGVWQESCSFTHPAGRTPTGGETCAAGGGGGGGGTDPQPGTFDATFRNVRGNEWWVETDVSATGSTIVGVDAREDGGAWIALNKQSYGSWAKSIHVEPGHKVEFRARASDGQTDVSTVYTWPPS